MFNNLTKKLRVKFQSLIRDFCVLLVVLFGLIVAGRSVGGEASAVSITNEPSRVAGLRFEVSGENAAATPTAHSSEAVAELRLRGAEARRQILVTAQLENGMLRDDTRRVRYQTAPAGIVQVSESGLIAALKDGTATVAAKSPDGAEAKLAVIVQNSKAVRPINFGNQIVPIFTKTGCNGGGCHGKSSGQNGFRLSLLGFEPAEDYEHLVKEARGRRLFPASPKNSLLLLKGTATLPHGGGKRFDAESDDYKLLVRWIAQGMPYGSTNDPTVERIEVLPRERTMALSGEQQLVVLAS